MPATPSDPNELRKEISALERELNVRKQLQSYRATLQFDKKSIPHAKFYLLRFDANEGKTYIAGFKADQIQMAQDAYSTLEKAASGKLGWYVVLVSVGSIESLKTAYPNYFADTEEFLAIVSEAASRSPLDSLPRRRP